MSILLDDRERDIQKVCQAVVENWEIDNGIEEYCAFCHRTSRRNHALDCAVLIAKDLMTRVDEAGTRCLNRS